MNEQKIEYNPRTGASDLDGQCQNVILRENKWGGIEVYAITERQAETLVLTLTGSGRLETYPNLPRELGFQTTETGHLFVMPCSCGPKEHDDD